eukprot:maker-scaffold278_size225338-snap-gene-0.14 protein:Tk03813 transcript:maker-scaffold278_size225338-snap-gene-0.14-mRNA-1 annotation:"centrosomal protein of 41 kda"
MMNSRRARPKVKPKIPPLDQRIPRNPKYAQLKPTVDTGFNTRKKQEQVQETRQFYRFRSDEVFRRISIASLVDLMLEVSKLAIQISDLAHSQSSGSSEVDSAIGNGDEEDLDPPEASDLYESEDEEWNGHGVESIVNRGKPISRQYQSGASNRSNSVADLIQSMGQATLEPVPTTPLTHDAKPYLILDVRDESEYLKGHIVGSESYSHTRLSRSINYESPSMRQFRNQREKIIVVYDTDEYIAATVATTLSQRGYDNIFMLSGGLRVAALKFPQSPLIVPDRSTLLSEESILSLEARLEDILIQSTDDKMRLPDSQCSSRMPSLSSSRPWSQSQSSLAKRFY